MSTSNMITVQKEIVVNTSQARAFEVFTKHHDQWWPKSHHVGKADIQEAVLEGKEGGRWFERGVDGSECDWGKVLVWNPNSQLVLGWQIDVTWQYNPDIITEIEINFIPEGEKQTRVTVEHRNFERFGIHAEEMRKSVDAEDGWTLILSDFAKAIQA